MSQLATTHDIDGLRVLTKAILDVYRAQFKFSFYPSVSEIKGRIADHVDRNALDVVYPSTNFNVGEDFIALILRHNGCCFSFGGVIENDAQNVLVEDFTKKRSK
jgi:hypothetical protein